MIKFYICKKTTAAERIKESKIELEVLMEVFNYIPITRRKRGDPGLNGFKVPREAWQQEILHKKMRIREVKKEKLANSTILQTQVNKEVYYPYNLCQ